MFSNISANITSSEKVGECHWSFEDSMTKFLTFRRQKTLPFPLALPGHLSSLLCLLQYFEVLTTLSFKLQYIQLLLIKKLQGILGFLGGSDGVEVFKIKYSPHSRYL